MKNAWLVVGLGNPEGKYFNTYHNLGFLCAEKLAAEMATEFKKKGNQLIAKSGDVFILKPLTYMNLSGQAVKAVASKYKIEPDRIIVFVDDLYIDKGNIRVSFGGGAAGHNGLRSINEILGTNQYIKIRVGIKAVDTKKSQSDYVLSKIDAGDKFYMEHAVQRAVIASGALLRGQGLAEVQAHFNQTNTLD
jgi:PTH1 family peptidyl-tRNA hydrolase